MLVSIKGTDAQIKIQTYIDIGKNNVSEGVFIKNAYRISYQYQKYNVEAGIQFDLYSNNPNTITGIDITGSREFSIKDFSFDVQGFYILNRFSDLLYGTNWGLMIETRSLRHFLFELGTNFKTYTVTAAAREDYDINRPDSKLHENFNLMYVITAYLKPHNNDWNVGLSCTNVDHYIINQSTNPVFNLQMTYKLKPNLTLNFETWYKQAGIFNINANHFGYFFRGGIKWEI
jgi:hypothetical protein